LLRDIPIRVKIRVKISGVPALKIKGWSIPEKVDSAIRTKPFMVIVEIKCIQ